jgi:hypothetical protein
MSLRDWGHRADAIEFSRSLWGGAMKNETWEFDGSL